MKIKINITRDVLEKTKDCKSSIAIGRNCAVSFAVRELIPLAFVSSKIIHLNGDIDMGGHVLHALQVTLPQEAINFITLFDMCKPEQREILEPFSFYITLNQEHLQYLADNIGISEVYRVLSESNTLELIEI